MHRVSTNFTLILKIVLPVMWIVFFSSFTLAVWFSGEMDYGRISPDDLRFYLPVFLVLGIVLLYWMVMRLKRVEMDEEYIYVSNYFKTYRYPYHQVEKIKEYDYTLFKTIKIKLKEKGAFGKTIRFIASRNRLQNFLTSHPNVATSFLEVS